MFVAVRTIDLDLRFMELIPTAAIVPSTVETTEAITAMINVFIKSLSKSGLVKSSLYHFSVNPVKSIVLFVELNEKTIRIRIGIYRKAKQMPVYMREKVFFI